MLMTRRGSFRICVTTAAALLVPLGLLFAQREFREYPALEGWDTAS